MTARSFKIDLIPVGFETFVNLLVRKKLTNEASNKRYGPSLSIVYTADKSCPILVPDAISKCIQGNGKNI